MMFRSGGEHNSLFGLPFTENLLTSKVTQIDDAIQYKPLVGSSACKEIRISLRRTTMTNRQTIPLPMTNRFTDDECGVLENAFFLEMRHRSTSQT